MSPGNPSADRISTALVLSTVVFGAALMTAAAVIVLMMTTHF